MLAPGPRTAVCAGREQGLASWRMWAWQLVVIFSLWHHGNVWFVPKQTLKGNQTVKKARIGRCRWLGTWHVHPCWWQLLFWRHCHYLCWRMLAHRKWETGSQQCIFFRNNTNKSQQEQIWALLGGLIRSNDWHWTDMTNSQRQRHPPFGILGRVMEVPEIKSRAKSRCDF